MICSFGNPFPVLGHRPVCPDQHSGSNNPHGNLAVHFFFTKGAILFHDFLFRVTEQCKRQFQLFYEFFMGCFLVRGDTQDDGIQFQEFAIQVTESLGFLGSPGGVVLGVEIDDQVFPGKIG